MHLNVASLQLVSITSSSLVGQSGMTKSFLSAQTFACHLVLERAYAPSYLPQLCIAHSNGHPEGLWYRPKVDSMCSGTTHQCSDC